MAAQALPRPFSSASGDQPYEIDLHKADGSKLGIDVDEGVHEVILLISAVKQEGLVAQWNEGNPALRVEMGHHIVEVNGIRSSPAAMKAECKRSRDLHLKLTRRARVPVYEGVSYSKLGDRIWMLIASFLQAHELLGLMVTVCQSRAAMLGSELCWRTMGLPAGQKRMERWSQMVMIHEKELWAWPLLHVRVLDLDLHDCLASTLDLIQEVLLHGLDMEESICSVRLRRVPAIPEAGEALPISKAVKDLVTLVNPVMAGCPAAARPCFMLLPGELGQLRLRFGVAFGHFKLAPVADSQAPGRFLKAIDFTAERCALQTVAAGGQEGEDEGRSHAEAPHESLLRQELGGLQRLPQCEVWATQDFTGWSSRLTLPYKKLLSNLRQHGGGEGGEGG